jgi:hypothetical protein
MTISVTTPNGNDDLADYAHTLDALEAHMEADLEAPTHEPESNYISHGDIMLWLASKTDGMYGDLRQAMQMSEGRSTLAKELKDLQTLLESDQSNPEKLAAAEAVLEQVKGTPLEAEVTELVGPMIPILEGHPDLGPAENAMWVAGNVKGWAASLESYVSDLDHQDKLALIEIQQTVGDIRDATQLASNLIASDQQASAAVIGNIRG